MTRHPDYYLEDGNLVVLVEGTLFNVHRSTLTRHSSVFRDVFALPAPAAAPNAPYIAEGTSDEFPLQLAGIPSVDFERLLWVLYPPSLGTHKAQTKDEWISILHLSTRWEFEDIRTLAIRMLESRGLDPIEIIMLSQTFNIHSRWTLQAYHDLCERPGALTVPEARALGLDTAIRVSQLRERLRSPGTGKGAAVARRNSVNQSAQGVVPQRPPPRRASSSSEETHGVTTSSPGRRHACAPERRVKPRRASDAARLVAEAFGFEMEAIL